VDAVRVQRHEPAPKEGLGGGREEGREGGREGGGEGGKEGRRQSTGGNRAIPSPSRNPCQDMHAALTLTFV
jgi:hypothetical protein